MIPVAAGGAAVLTCTYWLGSRAALAALALTVVVIFAWRLPGGPSGYVKDVTAGVFARSTCRSSRRSWSPCCLPPTARGGC